MAIKGVLELLLLVPGLTVLISWAVDQEEEPADWDASLVLVEGSSPTDEAPADVSEDPDCVLLL